MKSVARPLLLIGSILASIAATACAAPAQPVALRLQVSLTADELAAFQPALSKVDDAHPEFTVSLEEVPQASEAEKTNTELSGGDVPDVLRIQGLNVQQWIRRNAFLPLDDMASAGQFNLADFYAGPLGQYRWNDKLYGIPDTASPDVVFYNKTLFAAGGVGAPTDQWTYDDMRAAAIKLTVDAAGRHPGDPGFDPNGVVQWGWNGGLTYFWQNAIVKARGGDLCANPDCTLMNFTSPQNLDALTWWISLIRDDHAGLYDPYGGSQTGVPGDPFIASKAAMGTNGSFAIGQLNSAGSVSYDLAPPFIGVDGQPHTEVSTNGYVVSAATAHPNEAWALVVALTDSGLLADTWGRTGLAVPARKSAASSIIDPTHAPANQAAIVTALEAGEVFRPSTANGFAAYGATSDTFTKMNKGELSVPDGAAQLESAANQALAPDRAP